jgi:pilus assembly protein Flp/PilA
LKIGQERFTINYLKKYRKEVSDMSPNREKGQGLLEYALILVLVAIVVVIALTVFGESISELFSEVNSTIPG